MRGLMKEFAGLVPCTFWPPEGAADGLISEVVRTNEMIRNWNVDRGWGTPHLEAGVFNRVNGRYRVNGRTLADGLHPTENEKCLMRKRLEEWCELMLRRGKLQEGGAAVSVSEEEEYRSCVEGEEGVPEEVGDELVVAVTREEADEFEEGEVEEEESVEGLRVETERKRKEMEERVRAVDQEIRQLEEKRRRIMQEWSEERGRLGEEIGRKEAERSRSRSRVRRTQEATERVEEERGRERRRVGARRREEGGRSSDIRGRRPVEKGWVRRREFV